MKLIIINGPNLNLLGIREPEIYGRITYAEFREHMYCYCRQKGIDCELFQSNHEGDLVDKIQGCYNLVDGIIINPAAYTHTSIAIFDAIKAVGIPTVEVHISDIYNREGFRKTNYIKPACVKSFVGMGLQGYYSAVDYFIELL